MSFEEVKVAAGRYAKFETPDDQLVMVVTAYSDTAGKTFTGEACPQVEGIVETYDGPDGVELGEGDAVIVTGSPTNLRRRLRAIDPPLTKGDRLLVKLVGFYDTKYGQPGKDFTVAVDRSNGDGDGSFDDPLI